MDSIATIIIMIAAFTAVFFIFKAAIKPITYTAGGVFAIWGLTQLGLDSSLWHNVTLWSVPVVEASTSYAQQALDTIRSI